MPYKSWSGRSGDWLLVSGSACAFLTAVLLAAGPVQAQGHVYSWTDKDGTVHFSNTGPPPADASNVSKRVMPRHERRDVPQREGDAEIPFVFMGGDRSRRFVRVVLEGSRKRKNVLMLVDTGAQMTLIDEGLANELNVEHVEDVAIMGVTGTMPAWMGRLHSIELGDEELTIAAGDGWPAERHASAGDGRSRQTEACCGSESTPERVSTVLGLHEGADSRVNRVPPPLTGEPSELSTQVLCLTLRVMCGIE